MRLLRWRYNIQLRKTQYGIAVRLLSLIHILSALGLDKRTAAGVIRISFSPENTETDVDALYEALKAHQAARFPML